VLQRAIADRIGCSRYRRRTADVHSADTRRCAAVRHGRGGTARACSGQVHSCAAHSESAFRASEYCESTVTSDGSTVSYVSRAEEKGPPLPAGTNGLAVPRIRVGCSVQQCREKRNRGVTWHMHASQMKPLRRISQHTTALVFDLFSPIERLQTAALWRMLWVARRVTLVACCAFVVCYMLHSSPTCRALPPRLADVLVRGTIRSFKCASPPVASSSSAAPFASAPSATATEGYAGSARCGAAVLRRVAFRFGEAVRACNLVDSERSAARAPSATSARQLAQSAHESF
jgi:hypothetical protein